MGGIVATLVTHGRPELVEHLILVEAGVSEMTETDLKALNAWFDRWPDNFADRAEAIDFFGADARSTPAWVDGLAQTPRGLERRFDVPAMIETMRSLASTSRLPQWREISVPATLVRASKSAVPDDDIAEMIAVRPDMEVVEIKDSGHDVHLDQPARVAAAISEVLEATTRLGQP